MLRLLLNHVSKRGLRYIAFQTNISVHLYPTAYYPQSKSVQWRLKGHVWFNSPRSPVNSPHKGQWRGALMFSLICALNKRLSKHTWGWWLETPSGSLWRHRNVSSLFRNRKRPWSTPTMPFLYQHHKYHGDWTGPTNQNTPFPQR